MISRILRPSTARTSAAVIGVALVVVALAGCTGPAPFLLDDANTQVDDWVGAALSGVVTPGTAQVDKLATCRPTPADDAFGGADAADAGMLLAVRSTTTIPVDDSDSSVAAIANALEVDGWAVTDVTAPSVLRFIAEPPGAEGGYIEVIEFDPGDGIGGRLILNVISRCYVPKSG